MLAIASLFLAMLIGVPLGVYASTHPNTWTDRVTGLLAVCCITIPPYLAGLFFVLIFAVQFQVLPAIGTGDFSHPIDYAEHLILPAIALGIAWVGYFARLVRASMLEVLNTNYIRTAQAFGVHERSIFYRYALKNAIIPTIAVLGVGLGNLMGDAIFVEVIFARPGLGTLIYDSIESRNYPIVRGGVLVVAILFVLCNLLADLAYRFLDPRIARSGPLKWRPGRVPAGHTGRTRRRQHPRLAPAGGRPPPGRRIRAQRGRAAASSRRSSRACSRPTSPTRRTSRRASRGPSLDHLLGTDELGRDLLSRVDLRRRIALGVAIPAVLGGTRRRARARRARRLRRRVARQRADRRHGHAAGFPAVILALVLLSLLGPSLLNVVIVIAVAFAPDYARVAARSVLAHKQNQFVEAERSLGAAPTRILPVHVVPNILAPLIILLAMDIPSAITTEAGLSFLGLGVQPPTPSWGAMLDTALRACVTRRGASSPPAPRSWSPRSGSRCWARRCATFRSAALGHTEMAAAVTRAAARGRRPGASTTTSAAGCCARWPASASPFARARSSASWASPAAERRRS